MLGRSILSALALVFMSAVATAAGQDDAPMRADAKLHYEAGMARYAARDYGAAVREFQAGYALDPRREIVFAQAQATRLAGDCPGAVALYEAFLATNPPAQQIEATRIAVVRCQNAAGTTPVLNAPPAAPLPANSEAHWWRNKPGVILAGTGAVLVGAGLVLLRSAFALDADARRAMNYADSAGARHRAENRWRWGASSLVGGALLVVVGVGARF